MNDLYDRYLSGLLNEIEQHQLEQQLASDERIRNDFQAYILARQALNMAGEEALRQRIRQVASSTRQRTWSRRWSIAASVLLLLGIGCLLFWVLSPSPAERLFTAYLDAQDVYSMKARAPLEATGRLDRAIGFYEENELEQALPLLEQVLEDAPPQEMVVARAVLYLGLIHLQMDRPTLALGYFREIRAADTPNEAQAARWFTALAYLATKQTTEAQARVQKICEEQGYYTPQACKLEKELQLIR